MYRIESRSILLHSILRHLKFHINERKEVQKKLARDDSLDKTLEITGNLMVLLHSQPPVRNTLATNIMCILICYCLCVDFVIVVCA